MKKTREDAFCEYRRTGRNRSEFDLNDPDEVAALTGWNCARNEGRANAFSDYYHVGVNHSEYDLNDRDFINSMLRDFDPRKQH